MEIERGLEIQKRPGLDTPTPLQVKPSHLQRVRHICAILGRSWGHSAVFWGFKRFPRRTQTNFGLGSSAQHLLRQDVGFSRGPGGWVGGGQGEGQGSHGVTSRVSATDLTCSAPWVSLPGGLLWIPMPFAQAVRRYDLTQHITVAICLLSSSFVSRASLSSFDGRNSPRGSSATLMRPRLSTAQPCRNGKPIS